MRGFVWTALAVGMVGATIAAFSFRRRPPEPRAVATLAPARSPVTVATTTPRSGQAPTPVAVATPRLNAPVAASPSAPAEPSTAPAESLDDLREKTAQALDGRLRQLAGRVETFRTNLREYENGCRSGGGPWPTSGCDAIRQDLRHRLDEMRTSLETLDEEARRAAVYPGVRAELRRRHGLDEDAWDTLERRAGETLE
jgi:hypothetical protein